VQRAWPPPSSESLGEHAGDVGRAGAERGRLAGQVAASAFLQGAMPRVPVLEPALDGGGNPMLAHQVVTRRFVPHSRQAAAGASRQCSTVPVA
jgi:hypothetical protein